MAKNFVINAVHEYNRNGHLLYSDDYVGAFVRGRTLSEAVAKFPKEIDSYCRWAGIDVNTAYPVVNIIEAYSDVSGVEDADSFAIFESEKKPLTASEYIFLKNLALKSAEDFYRLYDSIPDKDEITLPYRRTFYGDVPRTADEMYKHTKNVNSYYFAEIDIDVGNEPDIIQCRAEGFNKLEQTPCYLDNAVFHGSYDEDWSLRKVLRRFIWHDRIHAKAMYRMACSMYGKENVINPFCFY